MSAATLVAPDRVEAPAPVPAPDLAAIEALYAGPVGDAYTRRNRMVPSRRLTLLARLVNGPEHRQVDRFPRGTGTFLEVGCNVGGNLQLLQQWQNPEALTGVDVNADALLRLPNGVRGVLGSAAALPLPDGYADLVFTCGVLIHVPAASLPTVCDELVRVAKRYVAIIEYEDAYERMIPWHGHQDVLWSRPHTYLLWQRHPELIPIDRGLVGKADGFDRGMGWCLWEKPGA